MDNAAYLTWVASEVVSAALLNTHLRDQLNESVAAKATAIRQTVWSTGANAITMVPTGPYKSADEIVNNSTTFQDDNHLFWTVAANEVWAFRGFLWFQISSGAPGFKMRFNAPGGSNSYKWSGIAYDAALGAVQTNAPEVHASDGELSWPALSTSNIACEFQGFIIIAANGAGTMPFQWAQSTAVASDLTLLRGSYIDLTRLA